MSEVWRPVEPYVNLRDLNVDERPYYDSPPDPPERPERAMGPAEEERIRAEVRSGRCPFPAAGCGWNDDCVTHYPRGADLRTAVTRLLPTPTTQPSTGNGHARNLGKEAKQLGATTSQPFDDGKPFSASQPPTLWTDEDGSTWS